MPSFDVLKFGMNWERSVPGSESLKGGSCRSTSKRELDSTCTTVAPWSASALLMMGPTPTQAKSATLRPAKTPSCVGGAAEPRVLAGVRGASSRAWPSPSLGAGDASRTGVSENLAKGPG